jgi:hypothetical protein
VPAALRRTERPIKQSPPKYDSACASPNGGWAVNGGFPSVNDGAATPVSQVNNEDMHSIYNEMPMSPIAGPITRNHWQVRYYFFLFVAHGGVSLRFVACPSLLGWSALTYSARGGPF